MGAASGAGRAIALAFADAGAEVAITSATTDAEEAFSVQRLGRTLAANGRGGIAEAVDMSIGANVQVAVRQIAKAMGAIDLLVVATAATLSKPAERVTDAEWARVVNLNLGAVFYACRAVGREMLAREPADDGSRGRIIVVRGAAPGGAVDAAAKAGVRGLVEALAREWSERGVAVNLIEAEADDAPAIDLALQLTTASIDVTGGRFPAQSG
jgi:NAD(P)-dependent dehydrogenase (short-subunit alcohol dehydrogenase family)